MKETTEWEITVLGLTTSGKSLRNAGIPYIGFHDLMSDEDFHALEIGKHLAGSLEGINWSHARKRWLTLDCSMLI